MYNLFISLLITFSMVFSATLTGTVDYAGKSKTPKKISMDADPICGAAHKEPPYRQSFIMNEDGYIKNVMVYLKDIKYDGKLPETNAVLDQQGCMYLPHVQGMMAGQELLIKNSDATLHNIHAIPEKNQEFNTGQPIEGMIFKHTFSTEEVMVPLKCDVHGWMNAYAGVLSHPFFAVSGSGGTFDLSGLPPGTYEIEAWHEQLGPMTQSVTIGEQETAEINFTFQMTS